MSIINSAVESVMDLIDALGLYATIARGAMGTSACLTCEVGASSPLEVYLDKKQYIPLDLTINAKHADLQTLSEAMNTIHETLTMLTEYPAGENWKIVDITTMTEPQIIGREESNLWMMASSLTVKVYSASETTRRVLLPYAGAYEVRSVANESQTLDTDWKYMNRDMTVQEIFYAETSNPQGGNTVYIGNE